MSPRRKGGTMSSMSTSRVFSIVSLVSSICALYLVHHYLLSDRWVKHSIKFPTQFTYSHSTTKGSQNSSPKTRRPLTRDMSSTYHRHHLFPVMQKAPSVLMEAGHGAVCSPDAWLRSYLLTRVFHRWSQQSCRFETTSSHSSTNVLT